MERQAKVLISSLFFVATSCFRRVRALAGVRTDHALTVLYYHGVPAPDAEQFARQMKLLTRIAETVSAGWTDQSNSQLFSTDKPRAAITFDDALQSVFDNALPTLSRLNLPCTIFVPGGWLGQVPGWQIEGKACNTDRVASAATIEQLDKALVTIGSHTMSHPRLSTLPDDRIESELRLSRAALSSLAKAEVDLIAFPYGDYDDRVLRACRRTGYRHVFTIEPQAVRPGSDPFKRGRVAVDANDSLFEFRLKALGAYRWMPVISGLKKKIFSRPHRRPVLTEPDVTVRRATRQDWPEIWEFLQVSYGALAKYKGEARWYWQFIDNPMRDPGNTMPTVWIAVDGNRVVGQIAVQAASFWIIDAIQPGGWIVDVMILPDFRGRQLGHRLYAAVAREVPLLMMLTMAPATRRMAERAGAITLNPAVAFSKLANVRPDDVRRYVTFKLAERPRLLATALFMCCRLQLQHIIAIGANMASKLPPRRKAAIADSVRIEEAAIATEDLRAFCSGASAGQRAMTVRNSPYLDWRFQRCPDLQYSCFVARRKGEIIGYSILRRAAEVEQRTGIISDLLTEHGDLEAGRALINHAIEFFGSAVCTVECVSTSKDIADLLLEYGFFRTRTTRATCSTSDPDLNQRILLNSEAWYFTKSDHDWDQIQVADA